MTISMSPVFDSQVRPATVNSRAVRAPVYAPTTGSGSVSGVVAPSRMASLAVAAELALTGWGGRSRSTERPARPPVCAQWSRAHRLSCRPAPRSGRPDAPSEAPREGIEPRRPGSETLGSEVSARGYAGPRTSLPESGCRSAPPSRTSLPRASAGPPTSMLDACEKERQS